MRYLILGCNGMAGHTVSLYLKNKGHDVKGLARKESVIVDTIVGDASDKGLLKKAILDVSYDVIVNCIGILNRHAEEKKDQAIYLNAYLPHYLESITTGTRTKVIHMSTDCVFSGKRGHYSEDDFKDGESFYDRSKALGELENSKDFTIRTSIIGPDLNPKGIGLLNWFMQQSETVSGYKNVMWTGITTLQLAKCIEKASEKQFTGLCNIVGQTPICKYDLLKLCNIYLREEQISIVPNEMPILDKSLVTKRHLFSIPNYQEMIVELAEWMRRNESLYPHYYKRK